MGLFYHAGVLVSTPGDQMTIREMRILLAYLAGRVQKIGPHTYAVKCRKSKGIERDPWIVREVDGQLECVCPEFSNVYRCLHTGQVQKYIDEGAPPVFYPDLAIPRPTYPQDWAKYKPARRASARVLLPLLAALIKAEGKKAGLL